jgi:hypothetical protein
MLKAKKRAAEARKGETDRGDEDVEGTEKKYVRKEGRIQRDDRDKGNEDGEY